MRSIAKGLQCALLLVLLGMLVTGCRGTAMNPGWTVLAADAEGLFSILPTGKLVALDVLGDGDLLWSYPVVEQSGGGGLLAPFKQPAGDGQIQTLDAVYGVPVLERDVLIFGSYDGHLYAFQRGGAETRGNLMWRFPAEGEIGPVVGGPAVSDGRVYFGSSDHRVYAVDLETGKLVWKEPFEGQNWIWGAPAVDDDRVYIGSMDHHVYALDKHTGDLVWKRDLGGSVPGSVALVKGVLYLGGVDKRLHALDATDGSELWATDGLQGWIWGRPVVHDGYVYVGSLNGQMHAFAVADGALKWEPVTLEGALRASPAVLGGYLFVGTEAGVLYRINMETGDSTKYYKVSGALLSDPVVVGNIIYLGTSSGQVYALDATREIDPLIWLYPPARD